ncbi:Rcc1 Domain-Containing Protein 1 [Manis pentadactyla]|nr:Rcc1 Domain-Containing Protein 1 [Manis pentadactyla]
MLKLSFTEVTLIRCSSATASLGDLPQLRPRPFPGRQLCFYAAADRPARPQPLVSAGFTPRLPSNFHQRRSSPNVSVCAAGK